jgi:PAS domain S-box-containing protein
MHGYGMEELIGRNSRILAPEESWDPVPFEGLRAMGLWKRESVNIHKNGKRFPVQLTSRAVRNAEGASIGIITACEDVTERRHAEEALRRSENSYRTLSDNLPGIVYRVHLRENSRMELFNRMLEPMTGYTIEELASGEVCSIDPLIIPEDRSSVVEKVKQAARTGGAFEAEYCVRRKNGDIRHFLERGRSVRGEDGSPLHIDGVILDITERKQAEEKLIQRQEALRSVYRMATTLGNSFKSVCDDVALSLSRLLSVSHVFVLQRERGRTRAVSGIVQGELITGELPLPANCPCMAVYTTKQPAQFRGFLRDICPDHPFAGHDLQNLACVPVLDTKDSVIGAISVIGWTAESLADDTICLIEIFARYVAFVIEREDMETKLRNAQKMEVIGTLAGGVAHEVRNPLNAIMAISDALAKDLGHNPDHQTFLAHIRAQVDRLSALMRDLLDLGKPVEQSHLRRISLREACADAVYIWRHSANTESHEITVTTLPGPDVYVLADLRRLHQVFINLLDNAAQHSPTGSEVQLLIHETGDDMCMLQVVDCGSGISEELLPRIFEPFFSRRKGGTGLGTSIVKQIVEAHGGTVTIANNDPAPGCTVAIRLPLAERTGR